MSAVDREAAIRACECDAWEPPRDCIQDGREPGGDYCCGSCACREAIRALPAVEPDPVTDAERALVEWAIEPDRIYFKGDYCRHCGARDGDHYLDCLVAAVLRERKDAADAE